MEISYTHAQSQRVLKQRNMLLIIAGILGALCAVLGLITASRDREVVLQPILNGPLAVNSSGVSREYLELITRDTAVLTLDRSPANLEYWMKSVLEITAPSAQGKIRGDLMKIVNEQRGSSIAQFFTIQTMELDTKKLQSTVTGDLHTIVGNKVVSNERRTFRFDWQYSGLSLKLVGFGMVTSGKEKDQ
ncbi:type IV conjugative transfer system protein TraE [Sphingobium sp. B12D2B]|uniref:type IV conjugative transfer system protein TraE n=1 Tax=Sphingobium sp. B12D2B TaxID=2940577 RepID=UPI00222407FA|nr:type IV conjugative transfer system protein TraE [Sphingobium sp. B12D2B]MCW2351791.1 conjugal transfer pilus assembly protein TraE [Sphingobium sp. B12D2B]